MANPSNTLSATITSTDANGSTSINRGLGNPTFTPDAAVFGELTINQQITGVNNIQLPAATIYNFYIKNLAPPGGATITMSLNFGAGLVLMPVLQPGGVFALWQVTRAGGINAVQLTPSAGTVGIEYFMGA